MAGLSLIGDLDAALAEYGVDVTLRRQTTPVTDLVVRASYRPFKPEEVTGGILAGDFKVVISPTGLDDADWKAAFANSGGVSMAAPFDVDTSIPKRGDKIIIENRLRSIEYVLPYRIDGVPVRIEMQAR